MLVTNCPRCGKPTPARLASPDEIVCVACGYDGPPTPDAAMALQTAREYLLGRNAAERQLTDARARALSQDGRLFFGVVFAFVSVPFIASFISMLGYCDAACGGIERYGGAVLSGFLLAGIGYYGIRSLARIKCAQDALRSACSALPPERKGDPARCRVCGGALPAGGAVIRCPFCAADNYADPGVISQLGEQQTHDVKEYELAIGRVESFLKSVTFEEQRSALFRSLGVLLLGGLPLLLVVQLLGKIELPPSPSGRYGFVATANGDCLRRTPGGFELASLVGHRVRTPHTHSSGVVQRVYSSFFGSFAIVADTDGNSDTFDPFDLCDDSSSSPRPLAP